VVQPQTRLRSLGGRRSSGMRRLPTMTSLRPPSGSSAMTLPVRHMVVRPCPPGWPMPSRPAGAAADRRASPGICQPGCCQL